jgi:hypothetical protein
MAGDEAGARATLKVSAASSVWCQSPWASVDCIMLCSCTVLLVISTRMTRCRSHNTSLAQHCSTRVDYISTPWSTSFFLFPHASHSNDVLTVAAVHGSKHAAVKMQDAHCHAKGCTIHPAQAPAEPASCCAALQTKLEVQEVLNKNRSRVRHNMALAALLEGLIGGQLATGSMSLVTVQAWCKGSTTVAHQHAAQPMGDMWAAAVQGTDRTACYVAVGNGCKGMDHGCQVAPPGHNQSLCSGWWQPQQTAPLPVTASHVPRRGVPG